VGEASFAPAPNAKSEDDGWLVSFGTNAAERMSAAFIVDAKDMKEVARVALPQRIPLGFHSYWCGGA
jgi:carotenoid cleavage dioxygenase